jgi:folate-dependent phosphoribosylglycinamide formyltransferase PurN
MRTALICSEDSVFNRQVLPAFLASFTDLAGIVVIHDSRATKWRRLKYEWRRSRWRLLDVIAFRLFYRLRIAGADRAWIRRRAKAELTRLPRPTSAPVHETADPNSPETRAFLERIGADLTLAACKTLLKPDIFDVPRYGTFVVHPGICPEYRNSHGCFWALARRDLDRVGATLLRIDEGSDTGPVYAYYTSDIDERSESHVVIQTRVVYDNLESIKRDLQAIVDGDLTPIDVSGRASAAWGQPRLIDYLRWKRAARGTA